MSYPQQPYPPKGDSNTLSIVGIVLGCVAFLFCPPLFGIAGLVCGIVANSKGERLAGTAIGVSIAGLVLGLVVGFAFGTLSV
ncbi:hypothetical protein [Streptomyces sulphureus]|uniref:hypothetical protein n=1 Tax=Streptomyces sulphureus TaxID=47758 RepID=UPI00035FFDED|nr:hypothetical protein [Streptomyces sulphureus]